MAISLGGDTLPVLHGLEAEGILFMSAVCPCKMRRYYRITEKGEAALWEARARCANCARNSGTGAVNVFILRFVKNCKKQSMR